MKERPKIIDDANEVVTECSVRDTRKAVKCAYFSVQDPRGQNPIQIRKLTRHANECISFLAKKEDNVDYDRFRLRLHKSDSGEFSLAQGREVKTVNPRHKRG